jgi:hypothetical protein
VGFNKGKKLHTEEGVKVMRIDPIHMEIHSEKGAEVRTIPIGSVSGARFASRDIKGMRKQLDDWLARGIAATRTNPSIFRIGRYLLTQAAEFEVQGPLTGGECEVMLIRDGNEILVSVGSDHCDRELDPLFQDKPKQMCPHAIASTAWPYSEVRDHWDSLKVYSHIIVDGHTIPFQDSEISVMVNSEFLLAMDEVRKLPDPMFLYCGTTPWLDSAAELAKQKGLPESTAEGIGDEFFMRLYDPVLDRTIEHTYRAVPLGDDLAERPYTDK